MSLRLDGLGLFYVVLILAISAPVVVYAIGHRAHDRLAFRGSGLLLGLFILSMLGVVVAGDAFTFLVAWETMSLASFALVLADHRRVEVRRAGWVYLVMTHTATAFITLAFLLLARHSGTLAFSGWAAAASTLEPGLAAVVFLLGLIGFGTKAGMVPLHIWLPRAHPVAASAVSALMSAVMVALGIYGLTRLGFEWLPPGPAWWGMLLIVLGAVSACLGVLYALMQHELKRLLAYSTVENTGISLLGLGVALVARSAGTTSLVVLAVGAALFQVLNHAVIKSLLFLGAGMIESAVGTRDLDRLGGLVRRMPLTAVAFFVGSAAISGVPPLNGFASEWLTLQALFGLGRSEGASPSAVIPLLAGGALALTAALTLACFVNAFGVSFLALPRSPEAEHAHDAGRPELAAVAALAVACVALGLAAAPATALIASLVESALVLRPAAPAVAAQLFVPGLAVGIVACAALAVGAARLLGPVRVRRGATWASGRTLHANNQYSSLAFAKPIRLMFADIIRPVREIDIVQRAGTRFVVSVRYRSHVAPIFERYLYRSITDALVRGSQLIRRAQNGSLQTYLAYVFVALLVALVLAR